MRRVELRDLPAFATRLPRERRKEAVHGVGVHDRAQQLAAAAARDAAPRERRLRVERRGAPALEGEVDGGAVAARERRQPAVREREPAPHRVDERRLAEWLQELRDALSGDSEQARQVAAADPWPVGDETERTLLRRAEHRGEHPVLAQVARAEVSRDGRARERLLFRPGAALRHVREDLPEREPGRARRRAPDARIQAGGNRVALEGEEGRRGRPRHQPGRVAQPHRVGDEQQVGARARPLAQPPEPLAERRAVGGLALPAHEQRPAVGERDRRIHRHRPVPAEAQRP